MMHKVCISRIYNLLWGMPNLRDGAASRPVNGGVAYVRILKSFVRKSRTFTCPKRIFSVLSLVRNVFSACCHLSETFFSMLSLVRNVFQYVVTCPKRFSVCCHLSEWFLGLLSLVRMFFWET